MRRIHFILSMVVILVTGCGGQDSEREFDTLQTQNDTDTQSLVEDISKDEYTYTENISSKDEAGDYDETSIVEDTIPTEAVSSSQNENIRTGSCTAELSHPEFLMIMYGGVEDYQKNEPFHGGNQSWFYDSSSGKGNQKLENEGCGLIAVCDILAYISMYRDGYENLIYPYKFEPGQCLDYDTYIDYVYSLLNKGDYFGFPEKSSGTLGTALADGVKGYSEEMGYRIDAEWNGRYRKSQSLEYLDSDTAKRILIRFLTEDEAEKKISWFVKKTNSIFYMLDQDIPVIMAVGPFSNMNMYIMSEDTELSYEGSVGSHYFIVTSAEIDYDNLSIIMKIETWGEQYYIDYIEFTEEICSGAALLSDILFINLGD